MLSPIDLTVRQESSLLGRTNPVVKLAVALVWLVGLALIRDPVRPLVLALAAIVAGLVLGRIPRAKLIAGLAPLVAAAGSIALANLVFAAANTDPFAHEIARVGPLRLTAEAIVGASAIGARVVAIVATGVVFAQTTDPTRLVDALVQHARVPERFAYGALAAYRAVPQLGQDLGTLRQARRIRGVAGTWHPKLLVGLLVRAIRHADQLALAMDARAFGVGPRTTYRPVGRHWRDVIVAFGGAAIIVALVVG
ncbi:MAG: energy-coupling factor transporter transmembrane protein EcfT [Chloroflexota bacterium]|nr:MAG: energy-coupling factor transporter transmembrane protein EcfT [Chloroflexota bacterium]